METNLLFANAHSNVISVELRDLFISLSTKRKIYKGTYLFQEGLEAKDIFLIYSGIIQLSKLSADGKELSLRICRQNDLIGELILFMEDSKYLLSARVLSDGEVYVINKVRLEAELAENGRLACEFMKWNSIHVRKIQSKFRDLILYGKIGALYSTLIRLSNSYGVQRSDGILIDLVLTNGHLANFCSAARESVSRILNDLKRKGVISLLDEGKIVIHDIDYLKESIGCENCPIEICNIN